MDFVKYELIVNFTGYFKFFSPKLLLLNVSERIFHIYFDEMRNDLDNI